MFIKGWNKIFSCLIGSSILLSACTGSNAAEEIQEAPSVNTIIDSPTPTASLPNILVIMTDDQPADTLWAMPKTRTLIADKGITFDNFVIPTSACCPSRASFLTGKYAHDTRVYTNEPKQGSWRTYKAEGNEFESLPVWLNSAGYRTGLFGKYMNGYNINNAKDYTPPGWDEWVTFSAPKGPTGSYYNYYLTDGTVHGEHESQYSTRVLTSRAEAFITGTPAEQPFFLYFSPYAPHSPFTPAHDDLGRYAAREPYRSPAVNPTSLRGKPQWLKNIPQYSESTQEKIDEKYLDSMETLISVDDAVGKFIQQLEKTGKLDNTLIMFLSDNGYMWGTHRLRYKSLPYDRATRVPALIRWDNKFPAGLAEDSVITTLDFTETILDAAQLTDKIETSGYSYFQKLNNSSPDSIKWRTGVLLEGVADEEHPAYCGWRTEDALFIRWATGEEEFYNYRKDPYELKNLAYSQRNAERVQEYRSQTRKNCVPSPPGFSWGKRTMIPDAVRR